MLKLCVGMLIGIWWKLKLNEVYFWKDWEYVNWYWAFGILTIVYIKSCYSYFDAILAQIKHGTPYTRSISHIDRYILIKNMHILNCCHCDWVKLMIAMIKEEWKSKIWEETRVKLIFSGTLKGLKGPLFKQHMTDNERREPNNFNFGTRLHCFFFFITAKK